MRTLVVTAANEEFMPMLRGLVASLGQWQPSPFAALGFLDIGLAPASREWISQHAAHIVEPGWDLPIDATLRVEKPHMRAFTARPFLPRYFPGYDVYFWIDADAWVQERYAIDWYLAAARDGAMAAVPHVDRAYRQTAGHLGWRMQGMTLNFGAEAGQRAAWDVYVNAGVFALRGDAPHWAHWAAHYRKGLEATNGMECNDQNALNHALWTEELPVHPLPALCNWLCHITLPAYNLDTHKFCEPFAPSQPLGVLHLAANSRKLRLRLVGDGVERSISLFYPGSGPQPA